MAAARNRLAIHVTDGGGPPLLCLCLSTPTQSTEHLLGSGRTARSGTAACLLRTGDWRPLDAPWWRGKEVSIIGADLDGNFLLRHCDGTVRLWDHRLQSDMVLAPSLREFVARIE